MQGRRWCIIRRRVIRRGCRRKVRFLHCKDIFTQRYKREDAEMREKKLLDDLLVRYPILRGQKESIWKMFEIMAESFAHHGKLLVAGNGGSAADADHIVGELMKGFAKQRKLKIDTKKEVDSLVDMYLQLEEMEAGTGKKIVEKLQGALPAIALTGHTALATAYANDVDPMYGFAQQVYGYGRKGDVFLGISTSGNSQNVLYAGMVAKAKGMKVAGLSGSDGGRLRELSDVLVGVPGEAVFEIQELHLPIYHCLCLMLEERFFCD